MKLILRKKPLSTATAPFREISGICLLRSSLYVCADMEVYRYFKEKGARISNPAEEFTGEHGRFLYGKREANERKYTDVHDHVLSIGLHDGVISSELWLDIQRKLDGNTQLKKGKSGTYSWLTGLLKCGKCGYAMRVMSGSFFYCSGKANHHICGGIDGKPQTSPKANKLKMQLETLNTQIDNLVDKIAETSAAIGRVLEEKLERLIAERESVQQELDKLGGLAPANLRNGDTPAGRVSGNANRGQAADSGAVHL
ncbi:MAG: recombinase zinc beta ribbon domain-containing protein [Oscillospiraceae bacterium]